MQMKINLPNKLSLFRVILVPIFMACFIAVENVYASSLVGAAVFGLASLTDLLDGKIARRRGLITNFGKFLDPLADKFLIFGACLALLARVEETRAAFVWVAALVMLRELAVTSMRLVVASSSGEVVAAKFIGKVKTTIQIVAVLVMLLEPAAIAALPALYSVLPPYVFSYVFMCAMGVITAVSGVVYLRDYWKAISE